MNSPRTGGILKGKKHSQCDHNGCGIKTVAGSVHKEAEGGEFLLSAKPLKSKKVITVTGTKRQIAEKINGAAGMVEGKQTLHVDPGQYVINARAMTDPETLKVTGTPLQIASAINSDKGYGIVFAPGAEINYKKLKMGGPVDDQKIGFDVKKFKNNSAAWEILDFSSAGDAADWMTGGCLILADAFNIAFGFPVYAIYNVDKKLIDHFVVKSPSGMYIDADGERKNIVESFAKKEMITDQLKLVKFESNMPIGEIPQDIEASKKLAKILKENINSPTKNTMATRKKSNHKTTQKYVVFYNKDNSMRERIFDNLSEANEFSNIVNGSVAPIKLAKGGSTSSTSPSPDKKHAVGALLMAASKLDKDVRGGNQKLQSILGKEVYYKSPDGKKWFYDMAALKAMSIKKLDGMTAKINAAAPKKLAKGGPTSNKSIVLDKQYEKLNKELTELEKKQDQAAKDKDDSLHNTLADQIEKVQQKMSEVSSKIEKLSNKSKSKSGFIVCQVLGEGSLQPVFRNDDGQMFFDSEAAALDEIEETITDINDAIESGDMDEDSAVTTDDYQIVPATLNGNTITAVADGVTYQMDREDDDWKLLKDGGSVDDEEVDLFEQYDSLPENIQALIGEYQSRIDDEDPYDLAAEYQKRFEAEGYTFDWGLDGEAINLRKLTVVTPTELAKEFSRLIREKLKPADMGKVIALSKSGDYTTACPTHEFCDANQVMMDAFENLAGRPYSFDDDSTDHEITEQAWTIAREHDFYHNEKLAKGGSAGSGKTNIDYNYWRDKKILGNYHVQNKDIDTVIYIAGFENNGDTQQLYQYTDSPAFEKIGSIIVPNDKMNLLEKGKPMFFETTTGLKVKINRIMNKLAKGGSTGNGNYSKKIIDAIISYEDETVDLDFIQPKDVIKAAEIGEVYAFDLRDGSDFSITERSNDNIQLLIDSDNFAFFTESTLPGIKTTKYPNDKLAKGGNTGIMVAEVLYRDGANYKQHFIMQLNPDHDLSVGDEDVSVSEFGIGNDVWESMINEVSTGGWDDEIDHYSVEIEEIRPYEEGDMISNEKYLAKGGSTNDEEMYHKKVRKFIKSNLPKKYWNTSLDEIPRDEFTDKQWSQRNDLMAELEGENDREKKYHAEVRKFISENLPKKYWKTSLDEIPRSAFTDKQWSERNSLISRFETGKLKKGGPVSVDAKTQKLIEQLEGSIASAATPDNMKEAMRAKVAELKANAKPAKSKPVSKTEILKFINSSKSGVTAEAIEGQFPDLSTDELSTALADLEKAGKAHVNDAGKITAGAKPKKADKNVLNDLKPKFNKQIDDYGITSAMMVDGELNTVSDYEIPTDTATAMENHLKGQKGPEKGQKKSTINFNTLKTGDVLFYVDDANSQKWIVTDVYKDGFEATDNYETKMFYFSELQNGWSTSKKSTKKDEPAKKAEPAHSGKTGSDLVKYVDKEIDGIIGKTLYFKAGANGKWIKGKIEAVEPFDKTKEHWNIEFYPVGGAKEFDAPMVSDKLTTKQLDEFIHGGELKKYTLTKPESEVIKDFDDAIKEIDICHEEAKSKRVSNQRKNPPVKKKPAEILKNKVSSLHGYALKRIEKKNPEKAPALKKILDRHKKELDAFFSNKK